MEQVAARAAQGVLAAAVQEVMPEQQEQMAQLILAAEAVVAAEDHLLLPYGMQVDLAAPVLLF
jgi:hypothetical protein